MSPQNSRQSLEQCIKDMKQSLQGSDRKRREERHRLWQSWRQCLNERAKPLLQQVQTQYQSALSQEGDNEEKAIEAAIAEILPGKPLDCCGRMITQIAEKRIREHDQADYSKVVSEVALEAWVQATVCLNCSRLVAWKVTYEFKMFRFLCKELKSRSDEAVTFTPGDATFVGTGIAEDDEALTTCALLESLLLHTRVLHDFFYKSRKYADDIVAEDFVPNWEELRPAECVYLKARKKRLNKAVAHLSRERLEHEGDEKKWNIDKINEEMGNVIEVFRQNLPEECEEWLRDRLETWPA